MQHSSKAEIEKVFGEVKKMPNAKEIVAHPHSFLLLGDIGSGKTTQLKTLPGKKFAYLFDSNAILSLQGSDIDYEEFFPDQLNLNVKSLGKGLGESVTNYRNMRFQEWQKDFTQKVESGFFDPYNVIAMDSATTFLDLIMDHVLTINGRAGQWPHQDDYGPQMVTFRNVCRTLMSLKKIIFMTGHMEMRQDDLSKKIFRQPVMTGRLKNQIPLLFSDIFVTSSEVDQKGNVKHLIQTVPDRMTTTVRCSFKGLNPFEDVTIDFSKPLETQGLGRILRS